MVSLNPEATLDLREVQLIRPKKNSKPLLIKKVSGHTGFVVVGKTITISRMGFRILLYIRDYKVHFINIFVREQLCKFFKAVSFFSAHFDQA